MNQRQLQQALSDLPLGDLRYFPSIGSTNDEALAWAAQGAPHLSLVLADEQTAGRGRLSRRWLTPPGVALALSLILRPSPEESVLPSLYTGLGALALVEALKGYGLGAEIKWPNDVLLQGRKVAGILVETVWMGERIESVIVGIGVNVLAGSAPPLEALDFPAISIEQALGRPIERLDMLHDLLKHLLEWRPRLGSAAFLKAWEGHLAYRGETVQVAAGSEPPLTGELLGLESDGSLRLRAADGGPLTMRFGDVSLRPQQV